MCCISMIKMHNMHVTFMSTNNNLGSGKRVSVGARCGNLSPLCEDFYRFDNRYAGKEIITTGQTEALYMYTQEM